MRHVGEHSVTHIKDRLGAAIVCLELDDLAPSKFFRKFKDVKMIAHP